MHDGHHPSSMGIALLAGVMGLCAGAVRDGSAAVSAAAAPGEKWYNPAWPYRLRLVCEAGEGDVAWATVLLGGRSTEDGRDLRMVTEDGRLNNFEILHHDPQLQTLIQYRVPPGKPHVAWLYYGNPRAPKINTLNLNVADQKQQWARWKQQQLQRRNALRRKAVWQKQIHAFEQQLDTATSAEAPHGPTISRLKERLAELHHQIDRLDIPADQPEPVVGKGWNPQRGVLLRVYRKAKPDRPRTIQQFYQMVIQASLEGAGFRSRIADGFNPFGTSDQYLSTYEGYLRIDQPGDYAFCSCSDSGSWIFVNNRMLLAWPGPHSWGGSQRGQKHGQIHLDKGIAHVRYYHEEDTGSQLAYLGWRKPGEQRFTAIPPQQWLSVRQARATDYRARDGMIAVPDVRIDSTYWIRDTDNQQATLVRCRDRSWSAKGKITQARWTFGDGLSGDGADVRHVYFRNGRPNVTLTVTDAAGRTDSVTVQPNIFQVDVVSRYFRYGQADQYAKIAKDYDLQRMSESDLKRCAEFWGRLERWSEYAKAVEACLQRFGDQAASVEMAAGAALACLKPNHYQPRTAARLYQLAMTKITNRLALARLQLAYADVLAWDLRQVDKARPIYKKVFDNLSRTYGPDNPHYSRIRPIIQHAVIGRGDAALLSGRYDLAEPFYRQAQNTWAEKLTEPQKAARSGGYPYIIEDLLARGEYEWALKKLDEWQATFPVQKLEGYTFFLRGKVLYVAHPDRRALQYLELAETVSPQALHVPEAVWLRANCLMAMKQYDQALVELKRIRSDFTQSRFYEQAPAKIAECEKELK